MAEVLGYVVHVAVKWGFRSLYWRLLQIHPVRNSWVQGLKETQDAGYQNCVKCFCILICVLRLFDAYILPTLRVFGVEHRCHNIHCWNQRTTSTVLSPTMHAAGMELRCQAQSKYPFLTCQPAWAVGISPPLRSQILIQWLISLSSSPQPMTFSVFIKVFF